MTIEPDPHDLVRTRAYLLWVEEGRPEGRDVEHWHRAVELVANEAAEAHAPEPATSSTLGRPPRRGNQGRKQARRPSLPTD
jgi:hypothetical protein